MTENRQSYWLPAIAGGIVGAALTALGMVLALQSFSPKIVREAVLADPGMLVEASDALRDRQYAPVLDAQRAAIETPFHTSWKGAAKPEVVLTYYYDYACGYCRKSNPDIDRLLAEDKGLRVVFRELPILGPDSVAAARVALAASKAGRFAAFHDAMIAGDGRPSPETIAAAAAAAGVPAVPAGAVDQEAELKQNFAIAGQVGATGTPLFIVGDRVLNSAVGYRVLKDAVADARKRA